MTTLLNKPMRSIIPPEICIFGYLVVDLVRFRFHWMFNHFSPTGVRYCQFASSLNVWHCAQVEMSLTCSCLPKYSRDMIECVMLIQSILYLPNWICSFLLLLSVLSFAWNNDCTWFHHQLDYQSSFEQQKRARNHSFQNKQCWKHAGIIRPDFTFNQNPGIINS